MKTRIILLLLCLAPLAMAQLPETELLFDMSAMSGAQTKWDKVGRITKANALVIEIRFEDLNCRDAKFEAGSSMTDFTANWPASFGGWDMPITLDTLATRTIDGLLKFSAYEYHNPVSGQDYNVYSFLLKEPDWNSYYANFHCDPGSCTTGKIYKTIVP